MSNIRALAPVERMAELEPHKISNLAGQIVPLFPRDCTREQAMEVARVALAYGLDPLMGELIPYQGRPYITIAGRWRIANDHPAYDGEETVPATENERRALGAAENEIVWRCTVYRKDRRLPTVAWGRAGGQGETNTVARRWTAEIAIKRAQHRALRAAFPNQIPTVPEDRDTRLDDLDERISDAQLKRIHALDRDAGVSDDERRDTLEAKFAVSSSRDLTSSQASAYMDERTVADAQFSEVLDAPEEEATEESGPMNWNEFWFAVRGRSGLPTDQTALANYLGIELNQLKAMQPADAWAFVTERMSQVGGAA